MLISNGNWYVKRNYRVKQYKTRSCKGCKVRTDCTQTKSQRIIERHEYAQALQRNRDALNNNPETYKQRQGIVEHPFGTMKRSLIVIGRGFDHIMTKKTKERASSDVGLIFTAYNLRRLINIIGISELVSYLREAMLIFFTWIIAVKLKIMKSKLCGFLEIVEELFIQHSPKRLIFAQNL